MPSVRGRVCREKRTAAVTYLHNMREKMGRVDGLCLETRQFTLSMRAELSQLCPRFVAMHLACMGAVALAPNLLEVVKPLTRRH